MTQLSDDAEAAGFSKHCPACGSVVCQEWVDHLKDHVQFARHCLSFKHPVPELRLRGPGRWAPASAGEPPVTSERFAVLLINADIGEPFLRPHYPGAKKPIPDDAYWVLLTLHDKSARLHFDCKV